MIYIDRNPNPSGAYPNPKNQAFPGSIALNNEQAAVFFEYNGFVTVTTDPVTVNPNVEAWEAWKASLPEPSPNPDPEDIEPVTWEALDSAYQEGVNTAYDQ